MQRHFTKRHLQFLQAFFLSQQNSALDVAYATPKHFAAPGTRVGTKAQRWIDVGKATKRCGLLLNVIEQLSDFILAEKETVPQFVNLMPR